MNTRYSERSHHPSHSQRVRTLLFLAKRFEGYRSHTYSKVLSNSALVESELILLLYGRENPVLRAVVLSTCSCTEDSATALCPCPSLCSRFPDTHSLQHLTQAPRTCGLDYAPLTLYRPLLALVEASPQFEFIPTSCLPKPYSFLLARMYTCFQQERGAMDKGGGRHYSNRGLDTVKGTPAAPQ